jgi:hypothetical protein
MLTIPWTLPANFEKPFVKILERKAKNIATTR